MDAFEAIHEEMIMSEFFEKFGVHPPRIGTFKRAAIENMAPTIWRRPFSGEAAIWSGLMMHITENRTREVAA